MCCYFRLEISYLSQGLSLLKKNSLELFMLFKVIYVHTFNVC